MPRFSADTVPARALPWRVSPAQVVASWPREAPLAALLSGDGRGAWSRWSILARPRSVEAASGAEAPALIERAVPARLRSAGSRASAETARLPFTGGWIASLSYDLGRAIEPAAQASPGAPDDRAWPHVLLLDCPSALLFDHRERRWWAVGPHQQDLSEVFEADPAPRGFHVGEWASGLSRDAYERIVRRGIEHIAAGDVFQVNLARRLSASFEGSPRALLLQMLRVASPWYGALLEWPAAGRAIVSMSPELFLAVDGRTGRVRTRPIKGTRPAGAPPDDLAASEKDRAELAMIIDLMRNDLGRVCEYGSIRAERTPALERHGGRGRFSSCGLLHTVGSVEGTLHPEVDAAELIRATFPPGSVTGAPKIRAMQLIDEMEPVRRGPYCGAIGCFSDSGDCALNVAIRTASIVGDADAASPGDLRGVIDYSVGAGIVSDSDPASEWLETEAKAAGFLRAAAADGAALQAAGA